MNETIRLANPDDAAAIAAIYKPFVESTAVSFERTPPSGEEMASRIARGLARFPWLVCEHASRVFGYAYAGPHRAREAYQWSVESSVYVAADARRRGIGKALYASLFQVLRGQGFQNVFAGATLPNPASISLHESMGFQPVGVYRAIGYKLGRWHDTIWWQLRLGDDRPAGVPEPPIPLAAFIERPTFETYLAAGLTHLRLANRGK